MVKDEEASDEEFSSPDEGKKKRKKKKHTDDDDDKVVSSATSKKDPYQPYRWMSQYGNRVSDMVANLFLVCKLRHQRRLVDSVCAIPNSPVPAASS